MDTEPVLQSSGATATEPTAVRTEARAPVLLKTSHCHGDRPHSAQLGKRLHSNEDPAQATVNT